MSKTVTRGTTLGAVDEITNPLPTGSNVIGKINIQFNSGNVYENEDAGNDTAHRFETSSLLLHDVVIQVSDNPVYFGDATNQRFNVSAGSSFGFTKLDISKLYFKNVTPGQNGKTTVIGTKV